MKVGQPIPKKKGNHSQGSVERTDRHKAYLTLKPQVWDHEVDHQIKQKAPNVRQGQTQGFDKMLFQLQGDEVPEKYILWKKDFKKKIVLKKPNWDAIFAAFVDLTTKAASMVIHEVFQELNISETEDVKIKYTKENPDYGPFRDKATQKLILCEASEDDGSLMADAEGKAAWDAFVKKPAEIGPMFLEEIFFRLEELIFGTDMIGRNAYQLLRKLIRSYKVDPNRGIIEWYNRINQLNGYMKHVPCDALENRNVGSEKYEEYELREILDYALPKSYLDKLFGIDWNIYEERFKETVDKLVTIELEIRVERAKEKADKELKDKVYGTKGTKRDSSGKPRVPDANKTTCKTCNKQHKGECWLKNGGGGGNAGCNNRNGGNKDFNKKQMQTINKMFRSHSSTKKDDSDSESEASADGWKKGINLVQQMFIAQQYQKDNGMHSDKEIDDIKKDELKGLHKKAKKAEKALKRS